MRRVFVAVAVAVAATAMWLAFRDSGDAAEPARVVATSAPPRIEARAASTADTRPPFNAAGIAAREAERAFWQARLERAQETLEAYRQSTVYPHTSQPLARHTDQTYPHRPIEEERALEGGKGTERATLRTSQERIFLVGDESTLLTLAAVDATGKALPVRIVRATAREIPAPNSASLFPEVPAPFNDEGSAGDAVAGDGVYGFVFQPKTQGFAGLFGQVRLEAMLQFGEQSSPVFFDVFYTPDAPATWHGGVRDAMAAGSLDFILPAKVREAGRYVVTGRVDGADGKPLALLTFNEELAAGDQEIRLTLFGKLVRDAQPAFPLTLRDVDGFLLHESRFPDRSLMPRLAGKVHVSGDYAGSSFADEPWSAEEKTRYLTALGRDVATAQSQVERLGKGP